MNNFEYQQACMKIVAEDCKKFGHTLELDALIQSMKEMYQKDHHKLVDLEALYGMISSILITNGIFDRNIAMTLTGVAEIYRQDSV